MPVAVLGTDVQMVAMGSDDDHRADVVRVAVSDALLAESIAVPLDGGGVLLCQHVPDAVWAVLAPLVDARAPELPLVSHLDDAGMRGCLRDAATSE